MSKIVERTLDFLELFAEEKRTLSLSDISRLLKIPASSCHDVLQTLQERGYIYELAPRAGYYPTRRLFDLAKTITEHDPVALRADILLRAMRDSLDESVLLAKVTGLDATYLLTFEPSHPLRFRANVGDRVRSLYATSGGKAILSTLAPRDLGSCLKSLTLEPLTRHTITSKRALADDIEAGRQRGWFLNKEESQDGVMTLSSLFAWNGLNYIVTVAGPVSRIELKLDWMAGLLVDACHRLEMRREVA
ncbi:IclR family transcriptional regulator [Bradyrhizobium sp.]|jgi:DNA-binding IclR family transcriptional regulator|uniref:IclR family transcriptional regulator n=1 Tax=Bradyrhizobium sp. TaxID=376 RepID=UPI003C291B15